MSPLTELRQRLSAARLCVLVDGRGSPDALAQLARLLIGAGVDVLQLREKRLDDHRLLQRARQLRDLTNGTRTLLVVNDRPDIALLAGADGVHVGQEDLPAGQVRTLVGPDVLVGVSTHSPGQARQAVRDGADYIGCGPTFPSPTKCFAAHPGLDFLRTMAKEDLAAPAFAIGGISEENLPLVREAGFRRIAVSSAVVQAPEPAAAARRLQAMLCGPSGSLSPDSET